MTAATITARDFKLGTARQHDYGMRLLPHAKCYETLLDAVSDILDKDPEHLLENPPTVEEASTVLSALEKHQPGLDQGLETRAEANRQTSADNGQSTGQHQGAKVAETPGSPVRAAPRWLTARALRQIVLGQRAAPAPMDDDAAWVVRHLRNSLAVEALYVAAPVAAINGHSPITIDHLLTVFGDHEKIAQAFAVSVGTVKGWGTLLPSRYVDRAEVLSGGRVKGPR